MASLWVIVTGLGVLVGTDAETPRSAHTLLLQPVPPDSEVLGVGIPRHETRMRLAANGTDINVENQAIVLPGSESPASLANGSLLLPLGELLEPPALRVRPDVFNVRFATIMEFTGGSLWPIRVERNFDLTRLSLAVSLRLTGAHQISTGRRINKNRFVANGLLYQKPLESEGAPVVRVGGRQFLPALVPRGQTGNLPVGNEDNYVFWLSNTADANNKRPEDFDRDFYLLYDWLMNREVPRFVPVVDVQFIDNPPGQCMFSYAVG